MALQGGQMRFYCWMTGCHVSKLRRFCFLDDDTVRSWHKQYLAEDWDAVAYDGWKGGQSRMTTAQAGEF